MKTTVSGVARILPHLDIQDMKHKFFEAKSPSPWAERVRRTAILINIHDPTTPPYWPELPDCPCVGGWLARTLNLVPCACVPSCAHNHGHTGLGHDEVQCAQKQVYEPTPLMWHSV